MDQQIFNNYPLILVAFVILIIWSVIWKGLALWKAGRNNDLVWFVVMFIINTAGILEIIYIFAVSNKKKGITQI